MCNTVKLFGVNIYLNWLYVHQQDNTDYKEQSYFIIIVAKLMYLILLLSNVSRDLSENVFKNPLLVSENVAQSSCGLSCVYLLSTTCWGKLFFQVVDSRLVKPSKYPLCTETGEGCMSTFHNL